MSDKRAPVVAAIGAALVALLAVFFLVLPKRGEVNDAKAELETVQQQTAQLNVQLAALNEAKANAPEAKEEIKEVDNQVPPTVNQSSLILLLKNAVESSGIEFADITVGTPAQSATGDFSTIPVTMTLEGTYFSLAEFLYRIETLPRAAKALSSAVTSTTDAGSSVTVSLTMQMTMELYTSDVSAGPGSQPGPTSGTTGA